MNSHNLGWLSQCYFRMEYYVMPDTAQEYWEKDDIALSWSYSASPLGLPDGEGKVVRVNGTKAQF